MNKINKQTKLEQTHRYREQTEAVRDDWRAEGEWRGLGEKAEGLSQNKHTHTHTQPHRHRQQCGDYQRERGREGGRRNSDLGW